MCCEPDNGVNWTLTTTLTLTLALLFNPNVVTIVQNGNSQWKFEEVLVRVQEDEVLYEVQQTMGSRIIDGQYQGDGIGIPNPDLDPCTAKNGYCEYATSIYRGALTGETEVKLQVVKDVQTSFGGWRAIGNETAVELPFPSLSLDSSTPIMSVFAPTFKGAYEANIRSVKAEVSISFDNGPKHSYLRDYGLGDPLWVYAGNIVFAMREVGISQAETIRISVLPVSSATMVDEKTSQSPK